MLLSQCRRGWAWGRCAPLGTCTVRNSCSFDCVLTQWVDSVELEKAGAILLKQELDFVILSGSTDFDGDGRDLNAFLFILLLSLLLLCCCFVNYPISCVLQKFPLAAHH